MIIEADALAIGYRDRRVGEDLSLRVTEGRVLALLGPNGCGKTTLLKTLLGLIPALSGEVRLAGTALAELSAPERARRLAYVPQLHAGVFGFAAEDVVLMGRTAHRGLFGAPSQADHEAAAAAMAHLGIPHLARQSYTRISGGERQLVLIARALAQGAQAIVLDEPTANLDFGNQGRVLREMRALAASGLAVVFTTHDPNHALRHADDVLLMREGRLVAQGEAASVLTRPRLVALYGAEIEEITGPEGGRAFLPG